MANITKVEFAALDISDKNYLSWVLDTDIHLVSKGLGETIKEGNKESLQDRAKTLIFLRHHLHDGLKIEYLTEKDPHALWKKLTERFDHQRTIVLPKARYEWMHLRLQDFKTVSEYNSELFRISSKLILCGEKITNENMLEKALSTFHASNVLLQQQYRERGFKKYSKLISCLLIAEQNNEMLMKNHGLRLTGSAQLFEANGTTFPEANAISRRGHGFGRGRARGINHGRNNPQIFQQQGNNFKRHKANESSTSKKVYDENCFRCGMKGHWTRTCCTAKHLIDLYQKSIKRKGKVETNFADYDGPIDVIHLHVFDFFVDLNGNIDHLIGGGVMEDID